MEEQQEEEEQEEEEEMKGTLGEYTIFIGASSYLLPGHGLGD